MESPRRYRTALGTPLYGDDQQESERLSPGDSTLEKTCYKAIDFYLGSRNMSVTVAAAELNCQRYSTVLKSCLSKPDSARKSLNLKVAFVSPNRDEEADASVSWAESGRSFSGLEHQSHICNLFIPCSGVVEILLISSWWAALSWIYFFFSFGLFCFSSLLANLPSTWKYDARLSSHK